MSGVTDWASNQVAYGYDDAGRKSSQTNPNGTSTTYSYDGAGRLTGIAHLSGGTTIASFSYTPDAAGNPLSVAETMSLVSGGTTSYSYDSLNRLRTVNYPDGSWANYTFDPMGNRTQLADGGGTTTYAYDRSDRLLSTSGQQAISFSWDPRGNQTAKGTHTFAYDQANRLASSDTGTVATYSYNGEGVRIGKTVGGVSTTYLQDVVGGLPHVLRESVGGQETLHIYGEGLAFEAKPDGSRRYYHSDALGSTRVVTDDAGTVVSAFNYDVYGAVRQSAGEGRSFTFTGEQTDESGLEFLRTRYYDPRIGRFLGKDPFRGTATDPASQHPYLYVQDNPVERTDPGGKFAIAIPAAMYGYMAVASAAAVFEVWWMMPDNQARRDTTQGMIDLAAEVFGASAGPQPGQDPGEKKDDRATSKNYRERFFQARPDAPRDLRIHHSLPQQYADMLWESRGINVQETQYLRGVPERLHTVLNREWASWGKSLGHTPTADEVIDFAAQIEQKYGALFCMP